MLNANVIRKVSFFSFQSSTPTPCSMFTRLELTIFYLKLVMEYTLMFRTTSTTIDQCLRNLPILYVYSASTIKAYGMTNSFCRVCNCLHDWHNTWPSINMSSVTTNYQFEITKRLMYWKKYFSNASDSVSL